MRDEPIAAVSAQRPKTGPKVLEEVRIKPAMNGGHTIAHHYEGYEHQPKVYSFAANEGERAAKHVARHTGIPMADAGGEDESDE